MQRLLIILVTACLLCLTPHLAFAEYDEDECSGNSCDAPPENSGGAGGEGGNGGDGGEGGSGGDGGDASASNFGIQKTSIGNGYGNFSPSSSSSLYNRNSSNSLSFSQQYQDQYQGQAQGFNAFNGNTTTTTVAPDLGEGIKDAAKENAKRANRAPDPAAAVADHCDTGGFTVQTGPVGGGTSAPTFPCEVQRTKETLDKLGSGWFDQYVTKPLLHGRLIFKGLFSWVPIIGS